MARIAFLTRVIDEAGNALGGSPTEVRVWDDFGATVATVITADPAGAITITQPITPGAGTQTSLTVTTAAVDTTITVASTTGFALGQIVPIYDGTTTKYRWITAILAGPPRLTLETAIGVIFSSANTIVGNPDMQGVIAGYVPDTTFHYIQTKDVASTRVMPPTLLPTMIGIQSLAILEEGAAAGTRPTLNFISPYITAADNAPSTRVDVTGPTSAAPTASAVGDTSVTGASGTVADALHKHAREAFAGAGAFGYAAVTGTATTVPHSDHVHGEALTTASASLGADVAITVSGTWVDGPSVSLVAGTWLIVAQMTFNTNGQSNWQARLWDGTTTYASGNTNKSSAGAGTDDGSVPLVAVVTPGSTTTYKISGTSVSGGGSIKAALSSNGVGNNATRIVAVRIG